MTGKVALVTGATRGIGRAIALRFAQEGADVAFTYRSQHEAAESLTSEIQALGVRVKSYAADAADYAKAHEVVEDVKAEFGRIDILVNNAGISESTPFTDYTEETFDRVMDLNVKGVFNATRAAAECMVPRGTGVILSTSSMVSISGQPSGFAYPASKFAVNGFTVSLARELGPKGIRVNAVAPGITETDMMKAVPREVIEPMIQRLPLRRLGQPEDIANAFVFLASDEASYITGVVLSVDGMART